MPRITTYSYDSIITPNDFLLGTNGDNTLKATKNFKVATMLDYLGSKYNLQSVDLIYNYSAVAPASVTTGVVSTNNYSADPIEASSVTNIYLSTNTIYGMNVEEFVTNLGNDNFTLMLVDLSDYNNYVAATVVSVTTVATNVLNLSLNVSSTNGTFSEGTSMGVKFYTPNSTSGGGVWGTITGTLSNQSDLQAALDTKLEDAPSNGNEYVRVNGTWAIVSAGGGGTWGSITGTLSAQTDLQNALDAKLGDAPNDNNYYARRNNAWELFTPGSGGGSLAWGGITGTLSAQTDLQTALDNLQTNIDAKANSAITLTAGTGITGGGNLTANRSFALDTTYTDGRYLRAGVAATISANWTYSGIPAFNGGTSGISAPFSVDSNQVVTNLNADRVDNLHASQFLRSDQNDTMSGSLTATSFKIGSWEIAVAANELVFRYNSSVVFKIGTGGTISSEGDGVFNTSL